MFGLSSIKLVAIAVVVIALIGGAVGIKLRLDHLNSEVATLTAQNATLTAANKADEANIKASNDAVSALQAQEAARSKAAQAAIAQAKQQAVAKQKQINQLLSQKATGNKATDCDLLDQNLNSELSQ